MTGPDYRSAGGGTNYQCLPDDPEYDSRAPSGVPHSKLRSTIYQTDYVKTIFDTDVHRHRVPCAVCETQQRSTKLILPAKTRCPSSGWVTEYKGYLMSPAEHHRNQEFVSGEQFRTSYVCVDTHPESLTSKPISAGWSGSILYSVSVSCSGDGALANCPPYLSDDRALSCVVCTK